MPSAQAFSYVPSVETIKNSTVQAAYASLFLAAFRFWSREPDKNPSRFDYDTFINELGSVKNTTYNVGVFVDDNVLGHVRKGGTPFANLENGGKFETGPGIPSKGFVGMVHSYWKPLVAAFGSVVAFQMVVKAASDSKTKEEFTNKFFKALSDKLSNLVSIGITA